MQLNLDDLKFNEAVKRIHEQEDGEFSKEEIKEQFEQWLQERAEDLLNEFEYYAFGPYRIVSSFDLKHETRPRFAARASESDGDGIELSEEPVSADYQAYLTGADLRN